MNQLDRDRIVYNLAREFLLSLKVPGVTEELLEKYLKPTASKEQVTSLAGIYQRMLESAQNANMRAGVVGKALGGVDKLRMVLSDFDPAQVIERYLTWEAVFDQV